MDDDKLQASLNELNINEEQRVEDVEMNQEDQEDTPDQYPGERFRRIDFWGETLYLPIYCPRFLAEPLELATSSSGKCRFFKCRAGDRTRETPLDIVVKTINVTDVDSATKALRELRVLKCARHPNIIKPSEMYETDEEVQSGWNRNVFKVYIITPFTGFTLEKVLSFNLPYTLLDVKRWMVDALRALEYLHAAKVVHGNINPNVFYCDRTGKLTLFDFSCARVMDSDGLNKERRDAQIENGPMEMLSLLNRNYNEKVDIFNVGVMLCVVFTGRTPFLRSSDPYSYLESKLEFCGGLDEDTVVQLVRAGEGESFELVREAAWRELWERGICARESFARYFGTHSRSMDEQQHREDTKFAWEVSEWMKILEKGAVTRYLSRGAKEHLRDDVKANLDGICTFINKAFKLNANDRMSATEALQQPFLVGIGETEEIKRYYQHALMPFIAAESRLISDDPTEAFEQRHREIRAEIESSALGGP